MTGALTARGVTLGYERRTVVHDADVEIPDGAFTAVLGPNACGKSTLLRGLARLLTPTGGQVLLDERPVARWRPKDFARRVALMPQTSIAPDGITVRELVSRGRHPYQSVLRQWAAEDEVAVEEAMRAASLEPLADRLVQELSGGQRQRVWAAMALAQQTSILLLDEPTTFLDLTHQYELLDLFAELCRTGGRTVVAVLHDLGHAARYADHVVVMHEGRVAAAGTPREVITAELVEAVFGLPCVVVDDPLTGTPLVVARPTR